MIKLLTAFWNIMLKRSGQETLPDSNFFLGLVFVFYFLTQLISGIKVSDSIDMFLMSFVIDAVFLAVWLRLLVEFFATQSYFRRSLIALFGTGGIFNIIASPLIIEFSNYMQSVEMMDELQIPVWLTFSFLLVAIWSIIIMAHIFSKVMSKPTYSMLVAIAYIMVNFLIQSLVLGS
ncbi:uncharacterized protein METZ01_LOCUS224006 [marine metagenome]|uniref:Yip1 domain-containing protein n=1 Tax=marine metagenome TaxID=408172 RepID=A0A382G8I1_9ZZZZ